MREVTNVAKHYGQFFRLTASFEIFFWVLLNERDHARRHVPLERFTYLPLLTFFKDHPETGDGRVICDECPRRNHEAEPDAEVSESEVGNPSKGKQSRNRSGSGNHRPCTAEEEA